MHTNSPRAHIRIPHQMLQLQLHHETITKKFNKHMFRSSHQSSKSLNQQKNLHVLVMLDHHVRTHFTILVQPIPYKLDCGVL